MQGEFDKTSLMKTRRGACNTASSSCSGGWGVALEEHTKGRRTSRMRTSVRLATEESHRAESSVRAQSFRWQNDCVLIRYKDINRNDRNDRNNGRLIVGASCEPWVELVGRFGVISNGKNLQDAYMNLTRHSLRLMMIFRLCWPLNHN